ncbi:hypothetical protein [Sphingomonas mesophila]|uniref:hypothetical protein n=1 Tax=Sphingomonas mesophila TaxID=2303576 RepID=UPI0013C31254|nr:hypothetical protein [Sphingomonas mesophila]
MRILMPLTALATVLAAAPAAAQNTPQDRLDRIFGALFGTGATADSALETQWRLGRAPLANQRASFDARVDADVRAGALSAATAARLKTDYAAVVALESRYRADGVFTTAERTELIDRYGTLTQVLADRGYGDNATAERAPVAEGRAEFERQVDAAVVARRLTRVAASRLKADYAALAAVEANHLRDGRLTAAERDELDERLDALDARLDGAAVVLTPRARLDAILRALPTSGLGLPAQARLRVEHGDLMRLEAAYARLTPTTDERAYLERRLVDLETRVRIRR